MFLPRPRPMRRSRMWVPHIMVEAKVSCRLPSRSGMLEDKNPRVTMTAGSCVHRLKRPLPIPRQVRSSASLKDIVV